MRRIEGKGHAVHEPPAVGGGPGKQAVHRRCQPGQGEPFPQSRSGGLGPVDPDLAATGIVAFRIRAEPDTLIVLREIGTDGEAGRRAVGHHVDQRRTPQAASGGKQGERFQDIGLTRTVFANQQVEPRRFLKIS